MILFSLGKTVGWKVKYGKNGSNNYIFFDICNAFIYARLVSEKHFRQQKNEKKYLVRIEIFLNFEFSFGPVAQLGER